jgi:hypothetical protein
VFPDTLSLERKSRRKLGFLAFKYKQARIVWMKIAELRRGSFKPLILAIANLGM